MVCDTNIALDGKIRTVEETTVRNVRSEKRVCMRPAEDFIETGEIKNIRECGWYCGGVSFSSS